MVLDAMLSGLNEAVLNPSFILPVVRSLLMMVGTDTHMVDLDVCVCVCGGGGGLSFRPPPPSYIIIRRCIWALIYQ